MRYRDLIQRTTHSLRRAHRRPPLSQQQVDRVLRAALREMAAALAQGEAISLPELGRLAPFTRPARRLVSPLTRSRFDLPARVQVALHPSPTLDAQLNAGPQESEP